VTEFRAGGQKHSKPVATNSCGSNDPKLLDQIACASGYAGGYMVTLSVVFTMFRWPIHVSALVTLVA
jgi:hypothetical protein